MLEPSGAEMTATSACWRFRQEELHFRAWPSRSGPGRVLRRIRLPRPARVAQRRRTEPRGPLTRRAPPSRRGVSGRWNLRLPARRAGACRADRGRSHGRPGGAADVVRTSTATAAASSRPTSICRSTIVTSELTVWMRETGCSPRRTNSVAPVRRRPIGHDEVAVGGHLEPELIAGAAEEGAATIGKHRGLPTRRQDRHSPLVAASSPVLAPTRRTSTALVDGFQLGGHGRPVLVLARHGRAQRGPSARARRDRSSAGQARRRAPRAFIAGARAGPRRRPPPPRAPRR